MCIFFVICQCMHVWVRVCVMCVCLHTHTSSQIDHEIWPLKKFPVLILLFELQSIFPRYQIHSNRCSVLNDTGPWQPATDVGMKEKHKIRGQALASYTHTQTHIYLHTLHISQQPCTAVITRIISAMREVSTSCCNGYLMYVEQKSFFCLKADVTEVLREKKKKVFWSVSVL